MLPVEQPFKTYTGLDGKPLDNGYVYFGQPGQDPIAHPVTVYWNAAGTLPAAQPLRTVNGYIMNAGAPANVFFDGAYSELVKDSKGRQVFYAQTSDEFSIATTVSNFLTNLMGPGGADKIGFAQGTVGRALRDAFSTSYSRYMTDAQIASVLAGADATLFAQAAIDAQPDGGQLHGSGATLVVTSLYIKSKITLSNFNLKTKAGAQDNTSPITIDGRTSPKTDIHLVNVQVDGNRANQTSIVGPAEDGGRHGFRMLGKCSNILIERCSAVYTAGDALELFSSTAVVADDSVYAFNNVVIRDFFGHWCRRHGMSADSVKGLRMDNVSFLYNGLDMNTSDPLDSGARGARAGGKLYGNGIDFEGYGLGSGFSDIRMSRVTGLYNARGGCLWFDASSARGANFVARQKIWISDCYFDEGQDINRNGDALSFSSTIDSKTLAYLYDSIYVENTRLDGYLLLRNVNNFQFSGEITTSTAANYALLDHSDNVVLDAVPRGATKTIYADTSTYSLGNEAVPTPANPTLAQISGVAGALSNIVCAPLENVRDRTSRFLITARWVASAAGVPVFRVTPAPGGTLNAPPRVDVVSEATGLPTLCSYNLSINSFRFNDPGTATLNFQIVVDIKT